MRARRLMRRRAVQAEPPRQTAADPLEQLRQLNELREQGILTEEEFVAEKKKLLES